MNRKYMCLTVAASVMMAVAGTSCKSGKNNADTSEEDTLTVTVPTFNADSAYAFTAAQCAFGPRTMNSAAHDKCGDWIVAKFKSYGYDVTEQRADLKGYDGTTLHCRNIMARFNPDASRRILLCAHWDSRPWADNDPDEANHRKPVMGANDGASGVGVMMEIARVLQNDSTLNVGVDFLCFDAEDWGTPQWEKSDASSEDTWALGAHHWAGNMPEGYNAEYGILLDMVGGEGSRFYKEGMSVHYASDIVDKVWSAAAEAGYSSFFPSADGGMITDDHLPLNQKAGIPTIDIIPYYPDCAQSSFGPTWHTIYDDMDHIDINTLKAVGQVVTYVIYHE
ncbi:MAG: M28 family peptidase [Prevotella sp.]